ncbi:type IX secretion/gliding motility protein PorT/SprT [Mongoliitalea daihaiensis]|uniref:type IX secretion/gliding motility protein PorT/SprT n=1 Tax=Mongoliitalea daihaiensis TaxID=2782006 RepID=UPI001F182446|nr:outer membrane beta-barrel protein [Mongoliitalea daihaiensis]UJP66666.1 outer membrane beta-barrel protein [Mongoliitalea daihaiensis]
MQAINFRYKFDLHWGKVILPLLFFTLVISQAWAQARFGEISKAGQDDKLISYGFFLAGHTNYYQLKYSEEFLNGANTNLANIRSITPVYTPGFSLGFLGVFRIHDQFNVLLTPKIGFYEFRTDINYYESNLDPSIIQSPGGISNLPSGTQTVVTEATMVELPLLFKYKAQRFNNSRMFFMGGGSAMWRTKAQDEADLDGLVTTGRDFTLDLGMGFDMYFKYFKFSPEIRFSHGLLNIYRPETTDPIFRDAIAEMRRKSITIYLHFQ